MMNAHHRLMLATALVAGLAAAGSPALGQGNAPESATVPTSPGFKPDTGQINPGREMQASTQSTKIIAIPMPEESRAALLTPVSKDPSPGAAPEGGQQAAAANSGAPPRSTSGQGGQQSGGQQGEAISGGPTPQQAGAEPRSSTTPSSGSTGTSATPESGPIGSVGETIPAKFSKRNDILDRTPMMAWPQPLSDQERARIYKEVMADQAPAAADADRLMPAGELSTEQALNGLHALPASLADIEGVKKLKYVKGKNTVLLVEPSTRIVVEQIKS